MKVHTNRPALQFQQLGQVISPVARSQPRVRRVRRDFGIRPQPGAGVPSGSRFGGGFQDRMRVINRFGSFGSLGVTLHTEDWLQLGFGALSAFGGSYFGAQAGVQKSSQAGETAQSQQSLSPALFSLLSDAAKAAGLEETAKALAVKKAAETRMRRPLSTTAKIAIGAGGAGALALLFLL